MTKRKQNHDSPIMLARLGLSCAVDEMEDAARLIQETAILALDCCESEETRRLFGAMLAGANALLNSAMNATQLAAERLSNDV